MTRRLNPPPVKCRAQSKRTGKRCRRWAIAGHPALLCWAHGGATDGRNGKESARAKEAANETLARMLEYSPRRDPWEIIADTVHVADVVFRDEWKRTVDAGELSAEQVLRLAEVSRYAHSMASSAITTKAYELRARIEEAKATALLRALAYALEHGGIPPVQRLAVEDAFWTQVERTVEGVPIAELEGR